MLANIKSIKLIKKIFLFLHLKAELKLIKNNKSLQNKFDINLSDYQIMSGKFVIFEGNGKGKEFKRFEKNLIYDGEYLDGRRHGKGKEYSNGRIIFEGEYLNGKDGKERNIIVQMIILFFLKVNIYMEKDGKEKNIEIKINCILKASF